MIFATMLIWLFCAVIAAILADHRGRSPLLWFILGVLFGVFAVILLLVISEERQEKIVYVQRNPTQKRSDFPRWPEEER